MLSFPPARPRTGGVGPGQSIARKAIDWHGGTISVAQPLPGGARRVVRRPA